MAWLVWILLTLLAIAAGYAVAAAVYPERGTSHRLVVLHVVTASLVLFALEACGYANRLERVTLGVVSAALFGGTFHLAYRHVGRAKLKELLRADVRAPWLLLRETWTTREIAVLLAVPAALAFGTSVIIAWCFPSWTFDPIWYHVPITAYAIQNHGLSWVPTHVNYIAGYPNNIELLAVWNCIFPMDNRFDETSQFPFAVLGVLVVIAWARKLGASRPIAFAAGAAFYALPPLFLLVHTTYVDVATNTCFAAAVYFALDKPTSRDRWMCFLAMGLFVGMKYSGAYQLLVVAPWLFVRVVIELWDARKSVAQRALWKRLGDVVLSVVAFAVVGLHKYVQNAVVMGNPVFPFKTKLPVLGIVLPGPEDSFGNVGAAGESKPWLFGTQADLQLLLDKWLIQNPTYTPEVHDGGFGPSFLWVALPCLLFVLGDTLRGKRWKDGLPILVLFLLVIRQPMGWWPRYTLAAALAAMVAFAVVHTEVRSRIAKLGLSLLFVWLGWGGYTAGKKGFSDVFPEKVPRFFRASALDRASMQIEGFQWPDTFGRLRETEFDAGDVITYDQSASFIAEYFTRDYRTKVTYVASEGTTPEAYVHRIRQLRARWVGVQGGTAAEAAVKRAGGVLLFNAPGTSTNLYRMPREIQVVATRE